MLLLFIPVRAGVAWGAWCVVRRNPGVCRGEATTEVDQVEVEG